MKTKTTHTPGPWTNINRYVFAEGLNKIARVSKMRDADLIAAAPEMLNALKALVHGLSDGDRADVLALIAKAEGK